MSLWRRVFSRSIRNKLILIFILVKVLPLVLLAWIAWQAALMLGEQLETHMTEVSEDLRTSIVDIAGAVTDDSIDALDRHSQEAIERLTTDTARAVAAFLYDRDDDILLAAQLPPDEQVYRNFLATRSRPVILHPPWQLSKDNSGWEPAENIPADWSATIRPRLEDNALHFRSRNQDRLGRVEDRPLYLEMSFVGLDGKEIIKVTTGDVTSPELRDVSDPAQTWCRQEGYHQRVHMLKPGEIDVSRMLGPAVPTNIIGPYTPVRADQLNTEFKPEQHGYAGKENPVGKRFQGLVRWATPVARDGRVIGYVTLALDHTHLMEFTDHLIPTPERYRDISDAGSGNYAFMWDAQGRNISHPRDYFIVGCDPQNGGMLSPWLEADWYQDWQESGLAIEAFLKDRPRYHEQSLKKKPALAQIARGENALDCRYLNFAPQCAGWHNLTQNGGSGSFVIFWSGLWKLSTAATIPYYTGQYGSSPRGFGWVTIGANVNEFHRPATESKAAIDRRVLVEEKELSEKIRGLRDILAHHIQELTRDLTVSTAMLVILVIVLAIWLANILTGHITRITKAMLRFREGEHSIRLPDRREDEMGRLSRTFNIMADRIEEAFSQLEKEIEDRRAAETALSEARDNLELRVEERTRELNEARLQAERANHSKTKFLANMSHELRTPLNAIIGFSDMICKEISGPVDNPKYLEFANDILVSGRHLLGLVNDLLEISRSEVGAHRLHLRQLDLPELVEECVHITAQQAKEADVTLEVDQEPDRESLARITADEIKLKQVVLNLMGNAIKFTPAGGTVRIETRRLAAQDRYRIRVTDTGIGIAPEDAGRVFEVFEQVSGDYDKDSKGAGLGLPLSKRLVELHGGTITLESEVGKGTQVIVEIPVTARASPVQEGGFFEE